jgi:hypothetical protein
LPLRAIPGHGVESDDELAHAGDEANLAGFAGRARHRGPGTGGGRAGLRLRLRRHRWRDRLYWRLADYGRVAGRTYIAWCLAAVSLPVLAGTLFDMTCAYGTAVLIAAGANVAGMAMALTMPRRGSREGG